MSDMPDKIWVDNEPDRKEVMAHKYFSGRALLENMRIPYHHDRIIQAKDAEIADLKEQNDSLQWDVRTLNNEIDRLKSGAKGGWMETALKQADEIAALRKALEGAHTTLKANIKLFRAIDDEGGPNTVGSFFWDINRQSITAIDAVLAPEKGRE